MRRISIKGVLIGGIVDIAASFLVGVFFLILFDILRAARHPHEHLHTSPAQRVVLLLSGLACSVLGGSVAAWIARHDELLNGGLTSFLCVGGGALLALAGKNTSPLWQQVLLLLASPACGVLGGYIWLRLRRDPALNA